MYQINSYARPAFIDLIYQIKTYNTIYILEFIKLFYAN